MLEKIKNKLFETKILLRSIPSLYVTMFCVSIIAMNLLANKSINLPFSWLALDAGIFVSWMSFLFMDIITKHFGLKAANTLTIVGVLINLIMCLLFFIISLVPGMWSESYIDGYENIINNALDNYGTIYNGAEVGEEVSGEDMSAKLVPFEEIKAQTIEIAKKFLAEDSPYSEKATQIILSSMGGVAISEAPSSYRQILIDLQQELKNLEA